ncbi:hypothetical protein J8L86_11450 [Shewanella sp. MMG014]|uniref:hypothetical protein n=1 Tax=Shewanella sp. MMG014 TaxID=2822691 RepID=UPI001B39ACDC|nr:hypothetical protein [Shewanella sp. MMG014]MBQ4890464.1 hypothetical protein [Shewanella sp. MMG014]
MSSNQNNYHLKFSTLIIVFLIATLTLSLFFLYDSGQQHSVVKNILGLDNKADISALLVSYIQFIFATAVGLAGAYVAITIAKNTEYLQFISNALQTTSNKLQEQGNLNENPDYLEARHSIRILNQISAVTSLYSNMTFTNTERNDALTLSRNYLLTTLHENILDARMQAMVRAAFEEKDKQLLDACNLMVLENIFKSSIALKNSAPEKIDALNEVDNNLNTSLINVAGTVFQFLTVIEILSNKSPSTNKDPMVQYFIEELTKNEINPVELKPHFEAMINNIDGGTGLLMPSYEFFQQNFVGNFRFVELSEFPGDFTFPYLAQKFFNKKYKNYKISSVSSRSQLNSFLDRTYNAADEPEAYFFDFIVNENAYFIEGSTTSSSISLLTDHAEKIKSKDIFIFVRNYTELSEAGVEWLWILSDDMGLNSPEEFIKFKDQNLINSNITIILQSANMNQNRWKHKDAELKFAEKIAPKLSYGIMHYPIYCT